MGDAMSHNGPKEGSAKSVMRCEIRKELKTRAREKHKIGQHLALDSDRCTKK